MPRKRDRNIPEAMNVLVTGDAGFIGSHLVDRLVSARAQNGLSALFSEHTQSQIVVEVFSSETHNVEA
jgi:nucleoside-diphosphate-sugar epimerase